MQHCASPARRRYLYVMGLRRGEARCRRCVLLHGLHVTALTTVAPLLTTEQRHAARAMSKSMLCNPACACHSQALRHHHWTLMYSAAPNYTLSSTKRLPKARATRMSSSTKVCSSQPTLRMRLGKVNLSGRRTPSTCHSSSGHRAMCGEREGQLTQESPHRATIDRATFTA
jgi:hypothetical protein